MEEYEIGSKILIDGKSYEIIDLWVGSKLIKIEKENSIIDVDYVNLKDENGEIISPIELDNSD